MNQDDSSKTYLLPKAGGPKIYLNSNKFTLGRAINSSCIIENLQVSRTHCLFENINGIWCLSDQSSNGTFLNHKKIPNKTPQVLTDGDTIKLTDSLEYIFIDKRPDSLNEIDLSAVLVESHILHSDSIVEVETTDLNNVYNIVGNIDEPIVCMDTQDVPNSDNNSSNIPCDLNIPMVPSVNEHTYCTNTSINTVEQATDVAAVVSTNGNILQETTGSNVNSNEDKAGPTSDKKDAMEEYEEEFQCIICTELFIKASTLNCSHSFCKYCIEEWNKKNKQCPICRTKINAITPTIVLDNFIAKIVESASQDVKDRRAQVIKEREKQETVPPIIIKGGKVLRSREVAIEISSDEDSYNEDGDDDDDFDYDDDYDESYNGRPGAYYGGYGYCYTCGDRGHWANGCPYR